MKRISLILLFLSFALLAQSKTFLPFQVTSSNGRPLNDYTVKLKQSGSTVATLTYLDNSAGWYYWTGGTSTVPWGDYDVYITISGTDKLWRSGVSIRNGYTISQVARDTVSAVMVDSLPDLLPRTTQYKDTTQLKAATSDSFGYVVNLKQLSSANTRGGGLFVLRPAAQYAVDGITAFASGGSGEWVRQAYIDGSAIQAAWGGAVGDGSNDDTAELQAAADAAETLNRPLEIGPGSYKITDEITVLLSQNEPYIVRGVMGPGTNSVPKTRIVTVNSGGFVFDGSANSQGARAEISNIQFYRDTTGISYGDTAIFFDHVEAPAAVNIGATGYVAGIATDLAGQLVVENPGIGGNQYGVYQTGHSDGVQIRRGFITNNSIAGVYSNFCFGGVITGTEISRNKVGVLLAANATWTIVGGRYEDPDDSCHFVINSGCRLNVFGASLLPGGDGTFGDSLIAKLYGADSYLNFYDPVLDGTYAGADYTVYTQAYNFGRVTARYNIKPSSGLPEIRVFDDLTNTYYTPNIFTPGITANPSITPAVSTNDVSENQILSLFKRSGNYGPSALVYYQEVDDGSYWQNVITDGNDARYGINGDSTITRKDRMRKMVLRQAVTLASSGNFTRDTVQIDKYDQYYNVQVTAYYQSDSSIVAKIHTVDNTNKRVVSTIYHKGVNSLAGVLLYQIEYQARKEDYP